MINDLVTSPSGVAHVGPTSTPPYHPNMPTEPSQHSPLVQTFLLLSPPELLRAKTQPCGWKCVCLRIVFCRQSPSTREVHLMSSLGFLAPWDPSEFSSCSTEAGIQEELTKCWRWPIRGFWPPSQTPLLKPCPLLPLKRHWEQSQLLAVLTEVSAALASTTLRQGQSKADFFDE